jgi:hypothetical protein
MEFYFICLVNLKFLDRRKNFFFIENIYFAAPWTLLPGAAALLAPPWIRPS